MNTPFASKLLHKENRYRLAVFSRTIAAVLGGYLLASVFTLFMSLALGGPEADAVTFATMLSFAVHAAAVIWVFAASTALRAWAGVVLPTLGLAALAYGLWLARGLA
ncbi:MAG: DUF3649 domain-containing protein [Campylobacterales bacterium]